MKRYLVVLISLWLFVALAQPAPLRTEEQARALAEASMKEVIAGEYEAAFEMLKPYWLFPEAELDELVTTTVSQRARIEARYGRSLGYELARKEVVGDTLLRLSYIEKTERHVLRWVFLFYKANDTWTLNSILWNDDINPLFIAE